MDHLHIAIAAEKLGAIAGVPITNTLVTTWAVMAFLIVGSIWVGARLSVAPRGIQNFLETLFEYVLDFIADVLGSSKMAAAFFPLLVTIFLFIWVSNWAEFLPGIGSIRFGEHPLLRSVNTDMNVTLALALIAFVVIEIAGVRALGIGGYAGKFFNFYSPLNFLVGVIVLASELARIVSFSFRLFGNIFAGEVLIAVATAFLPLVLPVPLMAFELFVGFIQAAVFALLTLFFIRIAMTPLAH